jgi:TRAP-type mannitol/chloroaromatic compound transport system permease large subunit
MRRSSLRAMLLVLLALDAFILGSLFIGVTTGGHHGTVWWLACIPLAALAAYFVWRTVRVWIVLRQL